MDPQDKEQLESPTLLVNPTNPLSDPSSILYRHSINNINNHRLLPTPSSPAPLSPSFWLELRLFYVRISPCVPDSVPGHLTLRLLRRDFGVALEINASRVPSSDTASLTLRRDRIDKDSSEVTYVSTDSVRVTGGVEFEVYEGGGGVVVLCGSVERLLDGNWCNGNAGDDSRNGWWRMDCFGSLADGSSAFVQPKRGVSAPSIEVYVAGCCSGLPVILTKTINVSPRRKPARAGMLDAIPENDDEVEKKEMIANGFLRQRKLLQFCQTGEYEYEQVGEFGHSLYSEAMYNGEDGQLSWFNAGVRVGVGIGLGMCLGIGIGVGLLMQSYQVTTRTFRRKFF